MKHASTILLAAVLFTSPALAQPKTLPHAEDHLEPDETILGHSNFMGGYELVLRDVLHTAYEPDVALRMIAQPSFVPEHAVGLRGGKVVGKGDFKMFIGGPPYRIFGLSPATSVWYGMANPPKLRGNEKLRDIKVAQCETGIDDALGSRIVEVWRKMLMRTRYSQPNMDGTDGASYHFSMFVRGVGDMSGHVWLPDRSSSTGTLVALANEMYDVCTKGGGMGNLEKLAAELEQRLK